MVMHRIRGMCILRRMGKTNEKTSNIELTQQYETHIKHL